MLRLQVSSKMLGFTCSQDNWLRHRQLVEVKKYDRDAPRDAVIVGTMPMQLARRLLLEARSLMRFLLAASLGLHLYFFRAAR